MIPPIIPLISDTPRLHQRVSRLAPRKHTSHHARNFATRSAHTLQAFPTRRPPKVMRMLSKRAFRTRLPPKVTLRVCKTSVSYETSSKSHASSLQNKRFVRDFLQKSSRNTHRSAHITQPCQAVLRFQSLQATPAHTPIPMSQRHSPLPLLTTYNIMSCELQQNLHHTRRLE